LRAGTKIDRWPVAEVPVKLSESPAFAGGRIDRGAPCYGEDNEYVYGELLGMTKREIADLAAEGVFYAAIAATKLNVASILVGMSGFGGTADDICSIRVLRI
jgi:hypothetical protein